MTILKQERLRRKLTIRQLAGILGISFQYVSLLENGKRKPSFDISKRLREFFGISVEELLIATDTKFNQHSTTINNN